MFMGSGGLLVQWVEATFFRLAMTLAVSGELTFLGVGGGLSNQSYQPCKAPNFQPRS